MSLHHRPSADRRQQALRREETERGVPGRERPGGATGPQPGREDDALRDLGTERVCRLLSALSTDQRCVLALRVVADLSVEDVAIALDKPPGAVKAPQRRALAALRRRLSQEGDDGEAQG